MHSSLGQLYGHLTLPLYAHQTSHNRLVVLRPLEMAVTVVPEVAVEADLQTCLGGTMATVLPSGRLGAGARVFFL